MTKQIQEKNESGWKLFNFRPVLFSALAFSFGVFCNYVSWTGGWAWGFFLLCILSLALLLIFSRKSFIWFSVLLLLFSFGFFSLQAQVKRSGIDGFPSGEYEVQAVVCEREETGESVRFLLKDLTIGGKEREGFMRIILSKTQDTNWSEGEEIACQMHVSSVSSHEKDSYRYGNISKKIFYQGKNVQNARVIDEEWDLFSFLRSRLKDRLYAGMDEESAGTLFAILTGDTSLIEEDLLENVRYGGIAHIFAVSGLHIGVLYAVLLGLLSRFLPKNMRLLKLGILTGTLLFYGGVCGFTASVIRAIVMCLVHAVTDTIGVQGDGLERTGLALLCVLVLSPAELFQVGCLLSFSACFGISILARPIKEGLGKVCKVKEGGLGEKATGFLGVSLSAQLFTAPFLLNGFGYVSSIGLLLNVLFVPLIGATFAVLLFVACLSMFFPLGASMVLLRVPSMLFSVGLLVFHAVDFSKFLFYGRMPFFAMCCYIVILTLLSDKVNFERKNRLVWISLVICLCVALIFLEV